MIFRDRVDAGRQLAERLARFKCEKNLLVLGIPRGKRIGELLHELRDKQLAEEIKSADEARAWVKQRI